MKSGFAFNGGLGATKEGEGISPFKRLKLLTKFNSSSFVLILRFNKLTIFFCKILFTLSFRHIFYKNNWFYFPYLLWYFLFSQSCIIYKNIEIIYKKLFLHKVLVFVFWITKKILVNILKMKIFETTLRDFSGLHFFIKFTKVFKSIE